ncbi:hypothetical protein EGM51_10605 [Verrucomicrobia bacterium S94]|nr:hypothetical protein EGM51_10605 [Verrucomicrobia bacterium S94]
MNDMRTVSRLMICMVLAASAAAWSANRPIDVKWDVRNGPNRRLPMQWFAGESVQIDLRPVIGRDAFDLDGSSVIFEVTDWSGTNAYLSATGTVSGTTASWRLSPEQANLPEGTYNAYALAVSGGSQTVLAWINADVRWSPSSDGLDLVDPWQIILSTEVPGAIADNAARIDLLSSKVAELEDGGADSSGYPMEWWFEPTVGGLARMAQTVTPETTITNNADVITYYAELTPLAYTSGYDVVVGDAPETVRFYSLDGYFDVNETNGYAVSVVDGVGKIALVSDSLTRTQTLTAAATAIGDEGYVEVLSNHTYIAGSVKEYVNTNMAAMIAGFDGTDDSVLEVFSLQDHANTNYVRNTNCWAYGQMDLTGLSPWNEIGDGSLANKYGVPSGQFRALTAITPQTVIGSAHYYPSQDSSWWSDTNKVYGDFEIRFVDNDNDVVIRRCVDHLVITNADWSVTNMMAAYQIDPETWHFVPTNLSPDYIVFHLDSPLPDSITPVKRLPEDWLDYIPYDQGFTNLLNNKRYQVNYPMVITDHLERLSIVESYYIGLYGRSYNSDYPNYSEPHLFNPPGGFYFQRRDTYVDFYRAKIVGDSSSPTLIKIGDDLALTATATFAGAGAPWSSAVWHYDAIMAGARAIGDTNEWETVDLSGFTEF